MPLPFAISIVYRQVLNVMDKYIEQDVLFCLDEMYLGNEKMAKLLDKVHIISTNIKLLFDPKNLFNPGKVV